MEEGKGFDDQEGCLKDLWLEVGQRKKKWQMKKEMDRFTQMGEAGDVLIQSIELEGGG